MMKFFKIFYRLGEFVFVFALVLAMYIFFTKGTTVTHFIYYNF